MTRCGDRAGADRVLVRSAAARHARPLHRPHRVDDRNGCRRGRPVDPGLSAHRLGPAVRAGPGLLVPALRGRRHRAVLDCRPLPGPSGARWLRSHQRRLRRRHARPGHPGAGTPRPATAHRHGRAAVPGGADVEPGPPARPGSLPGRPLDAARDQSKRRPHRIRRRRRRRRHGGPSVDARRRRPQLRGVLRADPLRYAVHAGKLRRRGSLHARGARGLGHRIALPTGAAGPSSADSALVGGPGLRSRRRRSGGGVHGPGRIGRDGRRGTLHRARRRHGVRGDRGGPPDSGPSAATGTTAAAAQSGSPDRLLAGSRGGPSLPASWSWPARASRSSRASIR